jgi:membrane associated rhomboid family serine protease
MTDPVGAPGPGQMPGPGAVCVRHPDRPTGLSCTRCGRPACTDCLREASVGYQCVDCVAQANQGVRRGTNPVGAPTGVRRPVVLPVLIAINLLFYVVTVAQSGNLMDVTRGSALFRFGALVPGLVGEGEWWRLILSGFLHYGLLHIALNMVALWMIGAQLEIALGRWRFLAVYGLSLLGCSTAAMLFYAPNSALIGASGAVFGLMGAFVVMLIRLKMPLSSIIPTIALNAVISVAVPGVSLVGHIGGFVVGALATAVLVYAPRANRTAIQSAGLAGLLVVMLVLCFAAA